MNSRDNINDPYYFLPSDSLIIPILNNNESSPANIMSNVFSLIFDNLLESDRFNEAVQNSMDTYNQELFKKTNEFKIKIEPELYDGDIEKKCFICIESLEGKVYKLDCGHTYHQSCLEEAVSHQHTKCSICNKQFPIQQEKPWKKEKYTNTNGHVITISSPEQEN
jgi:choline kinase